MLDPTRRWPALQRALLLVAAFWIAAGCGLPPEHLGGRLDKRSGSPASRTQASGEVCNYPATLEITSVNIGQGDATIIATPQKIVLADAGESYWNSHADADALDAVLFGKYGCRTVDHVLISHFQTDHIGYVGYGGLWYLVNTLGYTVGETILRDYAANVGTTSGTYDNWVTYLATADGQSKLNPRTAVLGEQIDLGAGVTLTVKNVDTRSASCPGGWGSKADNSCGGAYVSPSEVLGDHRGDSAKPDENDYSLGFVVAVGDFDMYIGGDTNGENTSGYGVKRHDVESYVGLDVGEVDVLRVNHHGSDHSSNAAFVAAVDAQAAIISVGNANTYGHTRQIAVDRLLGVVAGAPTRSTQLYLTERGDDGVGGCGTDYADSSKAAATLYGRATIVSDTDGNPCTVEGGNADIVVSADGSTFTIEGVSYTSRGASAPAVCGDGTCNAGEDCASCPADCPAPSSAACGNGVCETADGESCLSCPADCAGKQSGKASRRFCCGNAGENPVGCNDSRCSQDGFGCISTAAEPCCGDCSPPPPPPPPPAACDNDGVCEAGEDCNGCASDCAGVTKGSPSKRHCCGDGTAQGPEVGNAALCHGNV